MMFIANFTTGPGTEKEAYNVSLSLGEYLHSKVNCEGFLENLSAKYLKDFVSSYYFGGTRYVNK